LYRISSTTEFSTVSKHIALDSTRDLTFIIDHCHDHFTPQSPFRESIFNNMLFKNFGSVLLVIMAKVIGLAFANRGGNPGPTCGAPFCDAMKAASVTQGITTPTTSATVAITVTSLRA
jgi:hypothetical protein